MHASPPPVGVNVKIEEDPSRGHMRSKYAINAPRECARHPRSDITQFTKTPSVKPGSLIGSPLNAVKTNRVYYLLFSAQKLVS